MSNGLPQGGLFPLARNDISQGGTVKCVRLV